MARGSVKLCKFEKQITNSVFNKIRVCIEAYQNYVGKEGSQTGVSNVVIDYL